ncbi:mafr-1, partial [Pristionchus pacificus]
LQFAKMKFLEVTSLESLSSTITTNSIDCILDIKLEPYSCKMVQSDKKHWKKEYESNSKQRQALSPQEEELGLSPVGRRLRHLSESSRTDDCDIYLADSISPRTLFDLIAVLNSTFPDYDFTDRKSADFALVPVFETVQQKVDEKLSSAVFNYGAVKNDLWSTIKTEIKPDECTIYTFKADYTSDPFSEDGCFWYFNYFLHNKNLNRLLFLSCRALSASHSADVSHEQLWDLEEE